jgi:hypothetical protein
VAIRFVKKKKQNVLAPQQKIVGNKFYSNIIYGLVWAGVQN